MANKMRWINGDRHEITCLVDSATEIELGDLLFLDTDDAKPASAQDDQGSETTNQQQFHDTFLGVAMEPHPAGSGDRSIRIATRGAFQFDCLSNTFELGRLVSSDEHSNGTNLQNQVIAGVTTANSAIGRLNRAYPSATTTAVVEIISGVLWGGPQNIL